MNRTILAFTAACAVIVAQPAVAQTSAFTTSGETTTLFNPPFTLGYSFSLSQSFSLTGLGIFDEGGDGLLNSYDVGLWSAGGTLLASTVVSGGTAATLVDGYRYDAFSPITLGVGDYRIGALYTNAAGADPLYFAGGANTITPIAGVTYGTSAFAGGATLTNPTQLTPDGAGGYFGPNLMLGAVPEPSTWAMLLLGFGAIGTALRSGARLRSPLRRARA